jgi:peptide/nickel transport system permease protein
MQTYIIKRILLMIPNVILVSFVITILMRLIPGNTVDAMLAGAGADVDLDRKKLEIQLGLDVSLPHYWARWVGLVEDVEGNYNGLLQGNLGSSIWQKEPVTKLLSKYWPVTLEIGILGLIMAQLIALPIGILSALRQDTWGDYVGRSFAILLISVPSFWVATLAILIPVVVFDYMPPLRFIHLHQDVWGNLKMVLAPSFILGMALSGITMRMTRTTMLEVLRQDYIRTAWSKGLTEKVIATRHALKNALIPVISIIGIQLPVLIGGTVIIEQIYSLPGMGRLIISACLRRDYTLVTGIMFVYAIVLMLINLITDLTYTYLDPKVKYK